MNGDIDKVFLGKKRFTSLDLFYVFSCLARNCIALILCIVLHLFLRDTRTGNGNEKEWELSHGNRMGISLNIGNENGKA